MIKVDNLWLTYHSGKERVPAARGVTLDVKQGQFVTLLGPSGCGKTTTLRCIAGLEQPDEGAITIGDELVFSAASGAWVPPFRRNIGMVFQSYAIWPHMSVFDNVAFPLLHLKPRPKKAQIQERVLRVLDLVQLGNYANRPAPHLSGGQQQRLALARALVAEPRVLLLDEPLSNLDAKLRDEMRIEIRDLAKRLNVTTLLVTHEQIEALTMSDVVAVMKDGLIVQAGTPTEIYSRPKDLYVAQFVGRTNLIQARRTSQESADKIRVSVETDLGAVICTASASYDIRLPTTVAIRPEDIEMLDSGEDGSSDNVFEGRVEKVVFLGESVDCFFQVQNIPLVLKVHPARAPASGVNIRVRFPVARCLAMPV